MTRSRPHLLLFALVVAGLMTSWAPGISARASATQGPYAFTFSDSPSAPAPWHPSNWDVVVNSRDVSRFAQLDGMQADHGADCGPPPATHYNDSYAGAVFVCHDHLMTAIKAHGYGAIYLSPDHMLDFSSGDAVVGYHQSTARTSLRDWTDVWITPFGENLVLPLQSELEVDLQGPPRDAIHIMMSEDKGKTTFRGEVIRNFKSTALPGNWYTGYDDFLRQSAVTRSAFALHVSPTHIRFGMPDYNLWWIDTDIANLGWTQGIVQFGHHSYNPTKSDGCGTICQPNTWHWSNFSLSSAVPFTISRGDSDAVNAAAPEVSFPTAVEGSFLRFAGIGTIRVSLNGGRSWRDAVRQAQMRNAPDHFSSYWMPVPAGTSSVLFQGQPWYGGPWWVRDPSFWSAAIPPPPSIAAPVTDPAGANGSQSINAPARRAHVSSSSVVEAPRIATWEGVLVALVALLFAYLVMAAYIWKGRAARARAGADHLLPSAD